MELRAEFVQLADQPDANISQLCRRYGISRPTGYKWLRRYRKQGLEGLADRSRRPHRSPNKTPDHVAAIIIKVRQRFPGWGARKIRRWILDKIDEGTFKLSACDLPASSTITRILDRGGMLTGSTAAGRKRAFTRFEREAPNQLWQLDFKGEFPLTGGQLCYPLTVIDDHSRFNLVLEACPDQTRTTVQGHLEAAFRRYGLPEAILCDNGPPWGAGLGWGEQGPYFTGLAAWMMRLGIKVIYARPGQPQTKGKNERFNGTLQAELLNYTQFSGWKDARRRFRRWRRIYNTERPHQALNMQTPASRYRPSCMELPADLPPITYGPADIVRKVTTNACISVNGSHYQIGKAFRGHQVALRPTPSPTEWKVYFCHQHIRSIHLPS